MKSNPPVSGPRMSLINRRYVWKFIYFITVFLNFGISRSATCRLTTVGDLAVLNDTGSPVVAATINGQQVALAFDTGAGNSILWPGEVQRLGLTEESRGVDVHGVNGVALGGVAVVNALGIGSATAQDVPFMTAGRRFDGTIFNGVPFVGLIGQDFLSNYDIFFDLPDKKINLYVLRGCDSQFLQWTAGYEKVSVTYGWHESRTTMIRTKIDGNEVDALLDSGASSTLISRQSALESGISEEDLKHDQTGMGWGVEDKSAMTAIHKFRSLIVGSFHIENPTLNVGDVEESHLGSDFFRSAKIWIPRHSEVIYVQPVGVSAFERPDATFAHTRGQPRTDTVQLDPFANLLGQQ